MSAGHVVLAGGGTGGHLFPGVAVAHALRRRAPETRITFVTTDRPLDRDILKQHGFEQVPQPVRPWGARPGAAWRCARGWLRSTSLLRRTFADGAPAAVLGLGGYAAGPALWLARGWGARAAMLNPDAVPGRANALLARRCELIVTQWEASARHFRRPERLAAWGCPIRAEFAGAAQAEAGERFGLAAGRPVLLVTGASQGARTINEALGRLWPAFYGDHPEWQLLHLSGAEDEAAVRAAYASAGVPAQVVAFTHDMPAALAAATLVVSRAGASTLAELTALGKPSILLPYPWHRDQHQRENGRVLAEAGAALLLEDARDAERNARELRTALASVVAGGRLAAMAAAARRLGRADAAERVAGWLLGDAR